ncbi:MAG: hypothetical protein QOF61_2907 [Acidobacteriota bacterium]|jgi:uncharacterized membrane protein|nr:hypothetical protein [Acidobacteriota bacterium]
MTTENPRGDPGGGGDRLARLERSIADLSARLREVERQLNVSAQPTRQSEARPFGQGATPPQTLDAREIESASVEDYPFNVPPARAEESAESQPFASAEFAKAYAAAREREVGRGAGVDGASSDDAASVVARVRRDFESVIGGSLFNWLGIIAVTVAVGFFLKLAFEHEWIGATARVLLGGAAGCGVLALAEFLRARGYRAYAHVLTGGGILILYLSVYAARGFYELVSVATAFALMSVVTATAVALSVRHDARAIAVLGLIGGFMTPALLSTGVDRQIALFTYVAFLDAGVLALAYFKRWRVLDHLAFTATVITFVGWCAYYFEPWKTGRTFFFLTLFFAMFSALAVLHNVLRRRRARWLDLSLVIANATLYFAASYAILEDAHHATLGALALVVAVFYALLSYVAYTYHREDRLLASAYVGATVTFLALAIAIQFQQHWVTIGWATEGLALTWLGLRANERAPRYFALIVFTLAALHWLTTDLQAITISADTQFIPLFNTRALSCLVILAALACATWLYRRASAEVSEVERETVRVAFTLARVSLVLVLLTVDVSDYFAQRLARVPEEMQDALRLRVEETKHLTLSLVWTTYAAAFASVGLARRLKFLRLAGLAWLAVTAAKILFVDAAYYDAAWHAPIFNQTFAAFAVFVLAAWYVAHVYARSSNVGASERRMVVDALTIVGNLFAVVALSLEASGYFRKQLDGRVRAGLDARDLRLARQLSLSLVWAVYGGAMLAFGHVRQNRTARLLALVLLAATTLKVFFFDLSELDQLYRIVSFVVLGVVLLGVSFLYQQRTRRAKEAGAD